MKEFINKLIGRLEELKHDNPMVTSNYIMRKDAIDTVNELAEEYINTSTDTSSDISTTNADRIRSMTDEELADFLNCIHERDEDTILIPNGNKYEAYHSDDEILDWLQSEVEGVTENE